MAETINDDPSGFFKYIARNVGDVKTNIVGVTQYSSTVTILCAIAAVFAIIAIVSTYNELFGITSARLACSESGTYAKALQTQSIVLWVLGSLLFIAGIVSIILLKSSTAKILGIYVSLLGLLGIIYGLIVWFRKSSATIKLSLAWVGAGASFIAMITVLMMEKKNT